MVVNAPTGNTVAAAEHTMALMLALLRRIPDANASVQSGEWERSRYTGRELAARRSASSASARLGRRSRSVGRGFEMRVIATDPYLTEEQAAEAGARLVGLSELLHRSDVITIHTPLTPQTRNLLGRAQLEATKPGAFVLNVARGGIVDERAFADALASGHLARRRRRRLFGRADGRRRPLRSAPNVVLTPHRS